MTTARIPLLAPILALVLLAPGPAPAQQLGTIVVPQDAGVVIAARGAPQPRLAPRPTTAAPRVAPSAPARSSPFEPPEDDLTLGTAGQVLLPLAAAAALAATLSSSLAGRGGGGSAAPVSTR